MKKLLKLVLAATGAVAAVPAFAQSFTDVGSPFNSVISITANVQKRCTISVPLPVTFTYDFFAATDAEADTAINVRCNRNTAVSYDVSDGVYQNRQLTTSPANSTPLLYSVRKADGTLFGASTLTATGLATADSVPVKIRIPAGQDVAYGSYTGSVTITFTY